MQITMSGGQSNGGFIIHDEKDKISSLITVQVVPYSKPKSITRWKVAVVAIIITSALVAAAGASAYLYMYNMEGNAIKSKNVDNPSFVQVHSRRSIG